MHLIGYKLGIINYPYPHSIDHYSWCHRGTCRSVPGGAQLRVGDKVTAAFASTVAQHGNPVVASFTVANLPQYVIPCFFLCLLLRLLRLLRLLLLLLPRQLQLPLVIH